jgi:hypothetical protein
MRSLPIIALCLSCGAPAPDLPTTDSLPTVLSAGPITDSPALPKRTLRVTITLASGMAAPPKSGGLVVGWYRADEVPLLRGRLPPPSLLMKVIERSVALADQRIGDAPITVELPHPEVDAVPFALFDHSEKFFTTLFGGNGGGNLIGLGKSIVGVEGAVTLDEARPDRPPQEKRCAFEEIILDAPEIAGSIGNDTKRKLCVWLPPSYANDTTRRYPVLYLLPGFGGDHATRLRGRHGVHHVASAMAESDESEAILVGIDSRTKIGSSYFVDSPTHGAWDSYMKRVVVEIDRRYRTKVRARSRGLLGKSTGGFNAVSLALRHADTFSVVAASAPDGLLLDQWLLGPDGRVSPAWLNLTRIENAVRGAGQMASYAADWSFDAEAPRGFRWPYDLETGVVDATLFARWMKQSPSKLLDTHAVDARKLSGRIYINVGRNDEFGLFAPAKSFSEMLTKRGLEHTFLISEGGHFSSEPPLVPGAARFALRTLD